MATRNAALVVMVRCHAAIMFLSGNQGEQMGVQQNKAMTARRSRVQMKTKMSDVIGLAFHCAGKPSIVARMRRLKVEAWNYIDKNDSIALPNSNV